MDLIYTGTVPVTFVALAREVYPDEVFTVPDEDADAFLSRDDVAQVVKKKAPRRAPAVQDSPVEPDMPAPQAPDDTVTA